MLGSGDGVTNTRWNKLTCVRTVWHKVRIAYPPTRHGRARAIERAWSRRDST